MDARNNQYKVEMWARGNMSCFMIEYQSVKKPLLSKEVSMEGALETPVENEEVSVEDVSIRIRMGEH